MKYWEIIADNLSKAGWSWGCIATLDSDGEQFSLLTRNIQGYLVDFGFGVGRLRRVRPFFFCCVVGVRVLTTDFVGEAVGAGVGVANAAGVGVGVANAAGVGVG